MWSRTLFPIQSFFRDIIPRNTVLPLSHTLSPSLLCKRISIAFYVIQSLVKSTHFIQSVLNSTLFYTNCFQMHPLLYKVPLNAALLSQKNTLLYKVYSKPPSLTQSVLKSTPLIQSVVKYSLSYIKCFQMHHLLYNIIYKVSLLVIGLKSTISYTKCS